MNAHAQLVDILGRDVAGLIQDYVIISNKPHMQKIIADMDRRAIWRITDNQVELQPKWFIQFSCALKDYHEVFDRVKAHIALLESRCPFTLFFVFPGDYMYDIQTRYSDAITRPGCLLHEAQMEHTPLGRVVKRPWPRADQTCPHSRVGDQI